MINKIVTILSKETEEEKKKCHWAICSSSSISWHCPWQIPTASTSKSSYSISRFHGCI